VTAVSFIVGLPLKNLTDAKLQRRGSVPTSYIPKLEHTFCFLNLHEASRNLGPIAEFACGAEGGCDGADQGALDGTG
jgi:hypothetical protein